MKFYYKIVGFCHYFVCMFQQGGKFYLNASNWKRYQQLNNTTNNNNNSRKQKTKDKYCDIDDSKKQKISKFSCNLKPLNRLKKTKRNNCNKTGLRKSNSLYSISSVKERLTNEAGSNTGIDIYRFKQKMANTLSVMTNVLRNVVSKQRIRYKEKGFNLDLACKFNEIREREKDRNLKDLFKFIFCILFLRCL